MKCCKVTIDGMQVTVPEHMSILEAARQAGILIPTLCHLKDINRIGACRVCIVEVNGSVQTACTYPISEGLMIKTNTAKIRALRKTILELIIANHNAECMICVRSQTCELQNIAKNYGVSENNFTKQYNSEPLDMSSNSIVRDQSKCILCGRCVSVCQNMQAVGALGFIGRSVNMHVGPPYEKKLAESICINCGQCIINCPVGALKERDYIEEVQAAIENPAITVLVQAAPAVRAAIGEMFDFPMGTSVTGKMVAALRRLGFDRVFDTDFAADVCIMEESAELLNRIKTGMHLPLITSCSSGWIQLAETFYPEFMPHLSSCKSPQNIMGALLKSHYAEINGIEPEQLMVVSIMPCTAKKFEAGRESLEVDGIRDVDYSLTTRELGYMIKQAGIEFANLADEQFDDFYGDSTGAAVIFGTTGGVMEAAIRTVADVMNGTNIEAVDYKEVRGIQGVKEAEIKITPEFTAKVVVAHGGKNIKSVMERLARGELNEYHMIEFMACVGGCVNGGGQPIVDARAKMGIEVSAKRAEALYQEDANVLRYRKAHQNPSVMRLYESYLEAPNSQKAQRLFTR
ncbi:NADH-dependent [FeFe] hydrogenase, group A6 [Fusibacter sp. 3D3]|uniref:NADH-dependent [FeFe] hydrogenase, group A6 n=1 Tax=Fusibacter sp. 3D3 TaxID=1048380 RepID=UPI000853E707|nr:NADH-dependent [FeFe] hydrogenase, group A6 [Fusibacter sp. 3D3]GAU76822.1 periplasmic Fe-hydrogenase large subunit [Fusibacter sp. 3D3]